MSARLGKSVQNAHRVVGFLYIIEVAFLIGEKYLKKYDCFPENGKIDNEFIHRLQSLFTEYFMHQTEGQKKHRITMEIVERGRDLITGNIEQYQLLMYLTPEERFTQAKGTPLVVTSTKNEQVNEKLKKKQKRIIRLEPRKPEIMSHILLFPSIMFMSKSLHSDGTLKRSASILGPVLSELVQMNILELVQKGLFSSKWTPVYVKKLPDPYSTKDQMDFEYKLGKLGASDLSLEAVRETCFNIVLDGKGYVSNTLINFLKRPEYIDLELDMSILIQRSSKYIVLCLKILIYLIGNYQFVPNEGVEPTDISTSMCRKNNKKHQNFILI